VVRLVHKQYFEDIGEEVGYAYRYWDLLVEVDPEQFGVGIYRDEPDKAYVRGYEELEDAIARKLAREGRSIRAEP
jgi:hypothetical protein